MTRLRRSLPPRCPDSAIQVVEAAREVTAAQKLLWRRVHALDQGPGRCYASAEALAEDIGTGARNVEKMRLQLCKMGLMASDGGTGRGGAHWAATLPTVALPWTDRLKREDRNRLSEALDAAIRHGEEDRETYNAGRRLAAPESAERYDADCTIDRAKGTTGGVPSEEKGTTPVRQKVRRQFAERYDSSSLEEDIGGLRTVRDSSQSLDRTSCKHSSSGEEERSVERDSGTSTPAGPQHIGDIAALRRFG